MRFSRYMWSFFAESKEGAETIAIFADWLRKDDESTGSNASGDSPESQTVASAGEITGAIETAADDDLVFSPSDDELVVASCAFECAQQHQVRSMAEARLLYERLLAEGITVPVDAAPPDDRLTLGTAAGVEEWVSWISGISLGLAQAHPDYFVPYYFVCRFNMLEAIFGEFGIPLPVLPARAKMRERALYYWELNAVLQEFRGQHAMSPAELCAFLYDFAIGQVEASDVDLPAPGKSWLLIAGSGSKEDFRSLDEATADSDYSWQGNRMTRRGDICVMYCVRPRSAVHSIWRALSDGFMDPFFYYYSTIRIGQPVRVPELRFSAIRDDPVLGKNPSVRASLVGASGKPLTAEEYDALLRLLSARGCDISSLPRPRRPDLPGDVSLATERDVEVLLLEPLLRALGYKEADWLHGMPVRMGRGERVFPDYALLPHTERGEESAAFIVEAKLRIATEQQLTDAYRQCKSYALRLQSHGMALAATEGLWIFRRGTNGFSMKDVVFKSWCEIGSSDGFREVALAMSRDAIERVKKPA